MGNPASHISHATVANFATRRKILKIRFVKVYLCTIFAT